MLNVLQATIDAIAESDNELAGHLITRLRKAAAYGRDDGEVTLAGDTLTSPVDAFLAEHVGMGIDIIEPVSGVPTGNEGSYLVSVYTDSKNVDVTNIDGSAVSWAATQKPVRWRWTTLRVETTIEFPDNDLAMKLWVGEEPERVDYAEIDYTPTDQEFRGLGAQLIALDALVDSGSPTQLTTASDFFTSGMVGAAVWLLPNPEGATGNEGPQLITAFTDARNVTVSPGSLTTDETGISIRVKTYADSGYLTKNHRQYSEVMDGSRSYSAMDTLRRSFLVGYATEEELDRVGRNLAVIRPRGMSDETFRRLIQVLAYVWKGTVYCLELVLEALFPGGSWEIYEDLKNFPCTVFILLPEMFGNTTDFEGKAFLAPSGDFTGGKVDPDAVGRGGREKVTSDTATQVTVFSDPISVVDVVRADEDEELEMAVLPSADTPAWTYVPASVATEGQVFTAAVVTGKVYDLDTDTVIDEKVLSQTQPSPPTDDGGLYQITIRPDFMDQSFFEISAWFRATTVTALSGEPWSLFVEDNAIDAKYGLHLDDTDARLSSTPGSGGQTVTLDRQPDDGEWHHLRLVRETVGTLHYIRAYYDGKNLFGDVLSSTFSAAAANQVQFGYIYQAASTQNWTVQWDRVRIRTRATRNYWNKIEQTASFAGSDDVLHGTGFVAGDDEKFVRVWNEGSAGASASRNVGLWQVDSYDSATALTLRGVLYEGIASVDVVDSENVVTLLDPWFTESDVGKELELPGATLGTNSTPRNVTEYVSPWQVITDGADYVAEASLDFRFNPNSFVASTGVTYELIDAGTLAAAVLTLRDSLPAANTDVEVWYTSVLSAQILRNEFVENEGSGGTAGNVYYPFYVFDINQAVRDLMDEITAAGVIPEYEREF